MWGFKSPLAHHCDVAAHERVDGSGYHGQVNGTHLDEAQRVAAAADCYQAMTSERPSCGAHAPEDAAAEVRAMIAAGRLDAEAVERNVQDVHTKIGVSPRGTAARFAIESGVVAAEA